MNHNRVHELRRMHRGPLRDAPASINRDLSRNESNTTGVGGPLKSANHGERVAVGPIPGRTAEGCVLSVVNGTHQEANRNSQASATSTTTSGKSRRKTHVGPWRLGKTLGRGSTARVRLAKHAVTGQYAAVKIVAKTAANVERRGISMKPWEGIEGGPDEDRRLPFSIEREVVIMKLIQHPHVIALYDVWENRGELYLVLEYVPGGELFEYVVPYGLHEWEAVRYFRQMMAALMYCHSFGICHRDLKLENILLDANRNVKIADFGFAALQPNDRLLETPCGSPHYVAPEILQLRGYRGQTADIWSCGIILHILLAGYLPWDDPNVHTLLKMVERGEYVMPPNLSLEAKDFLWKILQSDPMRRITMEEIWQHPLMRKYDVVPFLEGTLKLFGGPRIPWEEQPNLPKRKADIDKEILRNLRCLWHVDPEKAIVERLLSKEGNQEKLFYYRLMRFREEHEQHYQSPGVEYSASDYHHTKRPVKLLSSRHRLVHSRTQSRRSQFSIVSNDNRPREGSYGQSQTARSVESYDPFRPSLNQLPSAQAEYANITVLRDNPLPAVPSLQPNGSLRHPAVTRLSGAPRSSGLNSAGSSPRASIAPLQGRSGLSGYASRSTITSNGQRATPKVASRSSNSGKRHVAFHHRRKSSNSNPTVAPNGSRDGAKSRFGHRAGDPDPRSASPIARFPDSPGSPDSQANPLPRSRKGGPAQARLPLGAGKSRAQSKLFKDEVRKVSTELGRYCEQVFNRDSVISSVRTSTTETLPVEHDTPETLASTRAYTPASANDGEVVDPTFHPVARRKVQEPAVAQGPTPKSAAAEHDSYTEAQLRETRDRLLQRSAQGGAGASQAYLDDVIAHLEKLMQPSTVGCARDGDDGRRTASTGGRGRSPMDPAGFLPVISEENRAVEGEEGRVSRQGHRAVSAPVPPRVPGQPVESGAGPSAVGPPPASTIRVVLPSMLPPMQPVAPLNVRKRSEQSTNTGRDGLPTPNTPLQCQQHKASASRPDDGAVWTLWPQDGPLPTRQLPQPKVAAEPIHEAEVSQVQEKTRKGWFRRNLGSGSKDATAPATTTAATATADQRRTSEQEKSKVDDEDTRISFEDFLMSGGLGQTTMTKQITRNTIVDHGKEQARKGEEEGGDGEVRKRRGFLKMFGKRVDAKTMVMHHDLQLILGGAAGEGDTSSINSSTGSGQLLSTKNHRSLKTVQKDGNIGERAVQPQQNWFARLMHIKPISRVLCFTSPRGRVRREVASILRHWKKYGIRDVVVDKHRNLIFGRVDPNNFLKIKPVSFACEVFAVLEHHRKTSVHQHSSLSMARFTLEQGAASSFYRVVETLEEILRKGQELHQNDQRQEVSDSNHPSVGNENGGDGGGGTFGANRNARNFISLVKDKKKRRAMIRVLNREVPLR